MIINIQRILSLSTIKKGRSKHGLKKNSVEWASKWSTDFTAAINYMYIQWLPTLQK
jgi:hypothetical protein